MGKDYIGNKKKNGFLGLVFFCVLAFAITFVISYSVTSYRNSGIEKKITAAEKTDKLTKELDELFGSDEKESFQDEKEYKTKEVNETVVNDSSEPEVVTDITDNEEMEVVIDVEVSAKPEKAVIPLAEGNIIKNFNSEPEYSVFFDDWRCHTGVDILGKTGDEIRTIADGTVVEAYIDPLCGGTMKIDHGAFCSVYMGMDGENMEMKGTVVKKGDTVGLLQGNIIGEDSRPHLHFEIIENDVYTDPMKYIG